MNCDWVRENIPLYLYDELADDARHELEGHVERCSGCSAELQALRAFHGDLSALPQLEVTPNLLAAARIQLSNALENLPQRRGWRWSLDPMAMMRQLRFSPALASVIFLIGFGGGLGAMYRMSATLHSSAPSWRFVGATGAWFPCWRGSLGRLPFSQCYLRYSRVTPSSSCRL